MANRRGKGRSSDRFPLLGFQNHREQWLQPWNQITIVSWQESDDKPRQCVEKQRHYSPIKAHMGKAIVFSVVMYNCESRTIKKAEHQRIHTFELWCWRRLLKVPWTAKRSNQSMLREINSKYSLEGLMLKLKLQHFVNLMQIADSLKSLWCWERLRAEGEGGITGWDGWMASPMQWTWTWTNSGR